MENKKFDEWAILELMGHKRIAGKVSEATLFGGALLRIDIPDKEGKFTTQFYGVQSIYCITPTEESLARAMAAQCQPEPVSRWEVSRLLAAPGEQ